MFTPRILPSVASLALCITVGQATPRAQAPAEVSGNARRYAVETWGAEGGLPNSSLSSVTIGPDGYLWISSLAGAFRFDGVRFTPVLTDLPTSHVRKFFVDSRGAVWAGLVGGGLTRFANGRLHTFTPDQLGSDDVRALAEDHAGRIWVGLEHGLAIIDDASVSRLSTPHLPGPRVTAVVRGRDPGSMWISTNGGVCELRGLTPRCVPTGLAGSRVPKGDAQDNVITDGLLAQTGDGVLWVGGRAGLFSMRPDFAPAGICATGCFRGHPVTTVTTTARGDVAAGFGNGDVAIVRRDGHGLIEQYRTTDGLIAGPVVSLSDDPEGSIWIAVYNGGLARLRPLRVRVFTTDDGLPAKAVGSIVQDRVGVIWAGAQCGPVSSLDNGRFVPRFAQYTQGRCTLALWAARDGALWIGTDDGLFRWQNNRMDRFDERHGLSDPHVRALFEDRDGVMWIGTLYGKLHTFTRGSLSRGFGNADGVAEGQLESFAQDHDGRVWIGSNGNGLSVFENGRFRRLEAPEAPPERDITGLFVDAQGDLWIATDRAGMYRRRNGRLENFGPAAGLGDSLVALMLEDRDGRMWASTARGISRLERSALDAVAAGTRRQLDPILIDRLDGMRHPEVSGGGFDPTGLRDRDGRLWFSTIDGIVMIDPARFPVNQAPPRLAIESASINGARVPIQTGVIDVPAGGPPLDLSYTALSFLAPRKMKFRYRLQGFDPEWTDAGTRRTAYYPHLPPGSYTFEVNAANNDGVWSSAPAALTVRVAPYWWERTSVRAAGLLLLLIATGGVVRGVTVGRARARMRELEREHALDRERRRIAQDLHDDIGARLTMMALMADRPSSTQGEIGAAARDAIQAMDELVWTVSAKNDTVSALITYCVAHAQEYLGNAGICLRVAAPGEDDDTPVTADTRRQVFLCLKEALNNVVKHAQATEVELSFSKDADHLCLVVSDNGRGFDPSHVSPTGNGLTGLRARAAAANGQCRITSAPGQGTTVTVDILLVPDDLWHA